jgi:SAM-dependent methyltransferase
MEVKEGETGRSFATAPPVQFAKRLAAQVLPPPVRTWARARWRARKQWPPVGWVYFGSLRRTVPISRSFGYDRGPQSVARYYIDEFVGRWAADIHGRVLEIGDDRYTRRFGGSRVFQSDVLHVRSDNPAATIVADLTNADHIPANAFDCLIITQTLQYIYDIRPAVRTLHRILKPSGVLLATFSGISQIARRDMELWGECWHFTTLSTKRLLEDAFRPGAVQVEAHGNVLAAIALLHGLASHELRKEELDIRDSDYQVIVTARAIKSV